MKLLKYSVFYSFLIFNVDLNRSFSAFALYTNGNSRATKLFHRDIKQSKLHKPKEHKHIKSFSTIPSSNIFQHRFNNPTELNMSKIKYDPQTRGGETGKEGSEFTTLRYISIIIPLLLVYVSNQWSRFSLTYLVNFSEDATAFNAINVDLNFSEAQYGALASVAFTALFAIASLFAGNFADKSDRKLLTVGSCALWSLLTFTTSIATDYNQVLISRILMGLACAFATPSAYTLLRDFFPKEKAALASSLYGSGVYFGGALSSLSILLDERLGWRGAFNTIALYGFACAVLAAFALPKDPNSANLAENKLKKGDIVGEISTTEKEKSSSIISDSLTVLGSSRRVQYLFLASFFRFSAGLCIGIWGAPYFRLAYPSDISSYAVVNALIVGLCGVTSGVLGGILADKVAEGKTDSNAGRLLVPIIGSLLAVPVWYMVVHSSSFVEAMTWLGVEYLVAECWFGPVVAVLQSSVDKTKGGTAQGLFTLTGALGGNLAPSILGVVYSSMLNKGSVVQQESFEILGGLLGYVVCTGYLLAALFFALSASAGDKVVESAQKNQ